MYNWSARDEVQSTRRVRRRENGGKNCVNGIQGMGTRKWNMDTGWI